MTDDPRHVCINCGHTDRLHATRDGRRTQCLAASGCECRIFEPVMPPTVTLPGPILMCAACCHTAHPGEACRFTQEKPGEVYECPCAPPTITEEAIGRQRSKPVADAQRRYWDAYLRKEQEDIASLTRVLCKWCGKNQAGVGEFCDDCRQDENQSDLTLCQCGHARGDHAFAGVRKGPWGCLADDKCLCIQFKQAHTEATPIPTYTPAEDTLLLEDVERIIETHSPTERPDTCLCGWRWVDGTDDATCLDNHVAREVLKAMPVCVKEEYRKKEGDMPTVDDTGHLVDEDGNCDKCGPVENQQNPGTLCTRCLHSPRYHRANGDCTYVNLGVWPPKPCPCGPITSPTVRDRITAAITDVDRLRVCKLSDADVQFIVDAVMPYVAAYPAQSCPAVLNIKGEHYPCDRTGQHDVHGSSSAGAIWGLND